MKYSFKEGNFKKGDILIITVDRKVNVYLMDNINFTRYKNNMNYEYFGSKSSSSPYYLSVPRTGHWYIVIDLGGGTGILSYSIKVYK